MVSIVNILSFNKFTDDFFGEVPLLALLLAELLPFFGYSVVSARLPVGYTAGIGLNQPAALHSREGGIQRGFLDDIFALGDVADRLADFIPVGLAAPQDAEYHQVNVAANDLAANHKLTPFVITLWYDVRVT